MLSCGFQYPLFRIVDCFLLVVDLGKMVHFVSISALSDRGLLLRPSASLVHRTEMFQYPLFRIVDCFSHCRCRQGRRLPVSISALSDRGLLRQPKPEQTVKVVVSISALSDRGLLLFLVAIICLNHLCFNIRSFGSWIASRYNFVESRKARNVSISALSDRGLLHCSFPAFLLRCLLFQYPLFRIVDCFKRP